MKKNHEKALYLSKKLKRGIQKIRFWRYLDLQKSGFGEVWAYKNKVWAKLGFTKIRFGRSQDLQKSGLSKVGAYKNQV